MIRPYLIYIYSIYSGLNEWKYEWRCFPEDLEGGLSVQLPLQKASLSDLWPLCLSPLINHPFLSAALASAGLTEIDWSTCWIFDQWMLEKLLSRKTRRFDRISQPASLSYQRISGCEELACLFCFASRYNVARWQRLSRNANIVFVRPPVTLRTASGECCNI